MPHNDYRLIHAVADKLAPRFQALFVAAINLAKDRTPDLTAALQFHSSHTVLRAINLEPVLDRMEKNFRTVYRLIFHRAANSILRRDQVQKDTLAEFGLSFDVTNPRAVEWIRRHAAGLLLEVGLESRLAVKTIVERMFAESIPPDSAARMIRHVIGLDKRQAHAVVNYAALQPDNDKVELYAKRLLRHRAEKIARTESIAAASGGQQELWLQAREDGLLEHGRAMRQWLVTEDQRLCPICAPIPSFGPVGLDEPFLTGNGSMVQHPPAHPFCRCATSLVFANEDGSFPDAPSETPPFAGESGPPKRAPLKPPVR